MNVDDNVEEDPRQQPLPEPVIADTSDTMVVSPDTPHAPTSTESLESHIDSNIPSIIEPPSTPSTQRPVSISMSPLTPLPETPHPSKFKTTTEERYTGAGWGQAPDQDVEVSNFGNISIYMSYSYDLF